jgi:hypothetical protein
MVTAVLSWSTLIRNSVPRTPAVRNGVLTLSPLNTLLKKWAAPFLRSTTVVASPSVPSRVKELPAFSRSTDWLARRRLARLFSPTRMVSPGQKAWLMVTAIQALSPGACDSTVP